MQSNSFAKESTPMKIDFKKIVCFALAASFGCLSAHEAPSETSKEISMSRIEECPSDECRMERCFEGSGSRTDKYDYDVYIQGEDCDEEERAAAPYNRRNCDNECPAKRTPCGSQCKRKGAAKVAQE